MTQYEVGKTIPIQREKCSMVGCDKPVDEGIRCRCLLCYASFCLQHFNELKSFSSGPYNISVLGSGTPCLPYSGFDLCAQCQQDPNAKAFIAQIERLVVFLRAAGTEYQRLWSIGYNKATGKS